MKSSLLVTLVISILILASCKKDNPFENNVGSEAKTVTFLNAQSYTDWVYFSFDKNAVVSIGDFRNSMEWDIAFHRGDIRLNGGDSGIGLGEAINTKKKDWKEVTTAPVSGYTKDNVGKITIEFVGDGVIEDDQPFSQIATTWLTVDISDPPPKYTLNNWVYVVKSADGRYVKLHLYDNKNEKGEAGYVSFNYQINEKGETTFQ